MCTGPVGGFVLGISNTATTPPSTAARAPVSAAEADAQRIVRLLSDRAKRRRQGLDIFSFQRRDKRFAKLFGQLLGDFFILSPAVDKFIQARGRIVMFQLRQKGHEVMDAAVGLLRARFQEIVKLFVASENFLDRKHKQSVFRAWRRA